MKKEGEEGHDQAELDVSNCLRENKLGKPMFLRVYIKRQEVECYLAGF